MKLIILILFTVTLLTVCSANASQPMSSCLEREWQYLGINNVTEAQKQFDLANDKDIHGGYYSCSGYTTPTELAAFLSKLKSTLAENNERELMELIYFPLVVIHEREQPGEKPEITVVRDKDSFSSLSNDLFSPLMMKVIGCMSLSNLATDPMYGIDASYGGIIIKRFVESRELYLTSLSKDKAPMKKWLEANCRWKVN